MRSRHVLQFILHATPCEGLEPPQCFHYLRLASGYLTTQSTRQIVSTWTYPSNTDYFQPCRGLLSGIEPKPLASQTNMQSITLQKTLWECVDQLHYYGVLMGTVNWNRTNSLSRIGMVRIELTIGTL